MQHRNDGYLRLPLRSLQELNIQHLESGLDEECASNHVGDCGTATRISGYTEWQCPLHAGLSIGWDWSLASDGASTTCERQGLPYSNLMLIDLQMNDLGEEATLLLLATAIDAAAWRAITRQAVLEKYAANYQN